MGFDLKRLGRGQQVTAGGAVALFVFFFFFDWYKAGGQLGTIASQLGITATASAWDAHTILRWLILLTMVLAIGATILKATGTPVELPVSPALVLLVVSGITTICVLWRLIVDNPGPDKYVDVKFGAWLGAISLIVIVIGAYMSLEAGETLAGAAGKLRASVSSSSSSAPAAEPGSAPPPAPAAPPPSPAREQTPVAPPPPPDPGPASTAPPPPPPETPGQTSPSGG